MSENINFIPANELPYAEGDEVEVLCLEGDELKRKAAEDLSGGSTVTIQAKYSHTLNQNGEGSTETHEVTPVPAGTFKHIKDGLIAGAPVHIMEQCEVTIYMPGHEEQYTEVVPAFYMLCNLAGTPEEEVLGITEMIFIQCWGFETDRRYCILPDDQIMTGQDLEAMGASNE